MKQPKRIKVYRWSRFFRGGVFVTTYTCRPRRMQARAVEIQTAARLRQLSDPRSQYYWDAWFLCPFPQTTECFITLE